VLSTFKNLLSQIQTLLEAWEWSASDHTLLVLPLHHTHGIVNVLCCALAAGASLEFFPAFDPEGVWDRFQNGRDGVRPTVFMAVPTIYSKLLSHLENTSSERGPSTLKTLQETGEMESKSQVSQSLQDGQKACRSLRLMVSGSAALPVSLWNSWKEKTGHALLERYGMTEIGMALSNPLHGERRPGHVGLPLPGVQVRLSPGENEIQIKSASVFREYWGRSKETADSFTEDGWFKTGDVAEQSEDGYFKILGRLSTDIIKTGGYKVSALEIEERLREHPAVQDCSVIGIADPEWGERIAVALLKKKEDPSSEKEIESWAKERMARYKVPTLWHFVEELPRNAMGKVAKPQVKTLFQTLIKPRTGSP
jgi:malonyl-CoA/methylmalonyl-CoA synthetase